MAINKTQYYGLNVDEAEEYYNVGRVNENTEKIDTALHKIDEKSHIHNNKSILDTITNVLLTNISSAINKSHTHNNKTQLDSITPTTIDWINAAFSHTLRLDNPHGINFKQLIMELSNEDDLNSISDGIYTVDDNVKNIPAFDYEDAGGIVLQMTISNYNMIVQICIDAYQDSIKLWQRSCNLGMWSKWHHTFDEPAISSPTLIGTPTAPTAPIDTNNTIIATTKFVHNAIDEISTVFGAYTGDGETTRTITLGFTPAAIEIWRADGAQNMLIFGEIAQGDPYRAEAVYGGFAVQGTPLSPALYGYASNGAGKPNAIEIVTNGFKVAHYPYTYSGVTADDDQLAPRTHELHLETGYFTNAKNELYYFKAYKNIDFISV